MRALFRACRVKLPVRRGCQGRGCQGRGCQGRGFQGKVQAAYPLAHRPHTKKRPTTAVICLQCPTFSGGGSVGSDKGDTVPEPANGGLALRGVVLVALVVLVLGGVVLVALVVLVLVALVLIALAGDVVIS